MKYFTLLITFLAFTSSLFSQYVIVNSPSSIAGVKVFGTAQFGADLTTGIWTADAVFVDDGSGATATLGCGPAVNGSALAGKIALIDRGTCEFGLKCLNAEQAGAIAAIVLNHATGGAAAGMGPGAVGAQVTIPCVMLGYDDGQLIRAELANGPVNITIGDYSFPNDIGTTAAGVVNSPVGVIPSDFVEPSVLTFTPGVAVTNNGQNDAVNVKVEATISFTDVTGNTSQVYTNENEFPAVAVDSTHLITLPTFEPSSEPGVYSVSYNITSNAVDDVPVDNTFDTKFFVSDNAFVKGGWDPANNRPFQNGAFTISGGGDIEFFSPFYFPIGQGYRVDSVQFFVAAATGDSLSGKDISVRLYEWIDVNEDFTAQNDEYEIVALGEGNMLTEPAIMSANNAWITMPLIDINSADYGYIIPEDDRKYVAGVRYRGALSVFFGFDQTYDYTQNIALIADANGGVVPDNDLPYFGTQTFDDMTDLPLVEGGFLFNGFRAASATAMYVNKIGVPTIEQQNDIASVKILPNPVNDVLRAEVTLPQLTSVEYAIKDMHGRLVHRSKKESVAFDKVEINVASLAAGQYYFIVRTEQGAKATAFGVQR
jgi:hypothetical protein